ncbi:MAG TPA: DUF72 domain-containing protein [Myxococcaceae bacterium]|nr:DUF72 domain-containing protein [Myxococcaceae bacterium]
MVTILVQVPEAGILGSMQLTLFEPGQGTGADDLEPAPVSEEVRAVASRLPGVLRMGGQSWVYPGWTGPGLVYAPGTRPALLLGRGLTAYSKHPLLRAMEIDRTFYEPLPASTFAGFAAQVPEGFRFPTKASQDCTVVTYPAHARFGARAGQRNPRLLDPAWAADAVVGPFVEGLGEKAGPLLFQFSPFEVRSPQRFAEKLHGFLAKLPKGPVYAVELRNEELLTEAYGRALADAGAVHCFNVWGRMPDVLEQRERLPAAVRRVLVARWLHPPGVTHEGARQKYEPFNRLVEEDPGRREQLATLAVDAVREGAEVYVMVNNKAEGCAPESIRKLAEVIAGKVAPR